MGTVESIDAAVTGALRHPMGPFRLLDIVGLDIHREVSLRLYEQLRDTRFAPPPMVDQMIAAGDLGRKAGRGFYHLRGHAVVRFLSRLPFPTLPTPRGEPCKISAGSPSWATAQWAAE